MGYFLLWDTGTESRGQRHLHTRGDGADGGSGVFDVLRTVREVGSFKL